MKNLKKVKSYVNKPKKEIIGYINSNLERLLYGYLEIFNDSEIEELKILMN